MDTVLAPRFAPVRFGDRLRIGMLLPSVNSEAEPQMEAMLPDGVSLLTTRLRMVESFEPRELLTMTERVEEGAQLLADSGIDRILFHCTAVTTFDIGLGDQIAERIRAATALPVTVTGNAVAAALRTLGARQVVMVTPYIADINRREVAFLAHHGVTVLKEYGAGLIKAREFRKLGPEHWFEKAVEMRDDRADAYFISCAQLRVAEALEALEAELGRPVVTSNQAALWYAMRESGVADRVAGFGTLLRDH